MKSENLRPQHQDTPIGKLLDLRAQIDYSETQILPFTYQMENWEEKEYRSNYEDYKKQIAELKKIILDNEGTFNNILGLYNLSVAVFLAKHINKIYIQ